MKQQEKFSKLWKIYTSFFWVGLLTIGGGIAMLPIIQKELIEKRKWLKDEEILEAYSLAQSIPGVIASNTAVLVGYRLAGVLGAIVALLGVISPSIMIILFIGLVFTKVNEYPVVQKAFKGIRVAVLALLCMSVIRMIKESLIDIFTGLLAMLSFILVIVSIVSPIYILLASALLGILIYYRREKQ